MDESTAKNGHLYAPISQKFFSKSKSHPLNAAHEQKTSIAQKKLVHTAILLTFTIRSKRRLKNSTSGKKNLKKTNTPLRVVKNTAPQYNLSSLNCKKPRSPQYSSAQLTAIIK